MLANRSRVFSIRVTDPMVKALDELLKSERDKRPGMRITRQDLIREALIDYLLSRGYKREEIGEG